jgi:hypothetical protein
MLETPHVAVGALIASKIPNPFISIPLSLLSHFVLDITPHWNPHINREIKKFGYPTRQSITIIRFDSVIALTLGSLVAIHALPDVHQFLNIMACSFVSVIPDVVEIPYYFFKRKDNIIEKWIAWQKSIQNDVSPIYGLSTQALITVIALLSAFNIF